MDRNVVARWESRSGKYWVEVYDDGGYSSPGADGARNTVEATIAFVKEMVNEGGYFDPSAAKTTMKRVI